MNNAFPGFDKRADELLAYIGGMNVFIILLRSADVVILVADDPAAFCAWLQHHGVRDIRAEYAALRAEWDCDMCMLTRAS